MATKIMSGFPMRRCSWSYRPIAPTVPTRRMIRWLDSVCLKHVTFRGELDGTKHRERTPGVANGA
jgi:hypothetical protein